MNVTVTHVLLCFVLLGHTKTNDLSPTIGGGGGALTFTACDLGRKHARVVQNKKNQRRTQPKTKEKEGRKEEGIPRKIISKEREEKMVALACCCLGGSSSSKIVVARVLVLYPGNRERVVLKQKHRDVYDLQGDGSRTYYVWSPSFLTGAD